MRLIDADALLEEFSECNFKGHVLKNLIEAQHTIDPESLRPKGEWMVFGKRGIYVVIYACSACHAKYDGKSNFCPNCGADMRKEQSDDN